MSVFDVKKLRRKPQGDGSSSATETLEDLKEEVPQVEDTVDKIDRALWRSKHPQEKKGCGCFG